MADNTAPGLVLGRVVDVDDPEQRHRVKLQRLDRAVGIVTDWAQIVTPFASNEAGTFFTPELDDLAVLGFNGSRPYVLGFVYGGDATPPATEPGERRIQSVNGHAITLADNDTDGIIIADAHGNEVVMNADGIALTSQGNITITAQGDITIEASGTTTIKGATVELNP